MLQDKDIRDVREAEPRPLEPAAAQPASNGTPDMGGGRVAERHEHANGDSREGADASRAMQASSAGAGQVARDPEKTGTQSQHRLTGMRAHTTPLRRRSGSADHIKN